MPMPYENVLIVGTGSGLSAALARACSRNGMKVALLPKKTRGGTVQVQLRLHQGDEASLKGMAPRGRLAGAMLATVKSGLSIKEGAGAFVCGESSALMTAIEGRVLVHCHAGCSAVEVIARSGEKITARRSRDRFSTRTGRNSARMGAASAPPTRMSFRS